MGWCNCSLIVCKKPVSSGDGFYGNAFLHYLQSSLPYGDNGDARKDRKEKEYNFF